MSLAHLANTINGAVASLPNIDSIKPEEKAALLAACDSLKTSISSPFDIISEIFLGTQHHAIALLGIEMGIFDLMITKPDGMDIEQLACALDSDSRLVVRIMRTLARMGFFQEIGHNKYTATPLAGALCSASPLSAGVYQFAISGEVLLKSPSYFAKHGYRNPDDAWAGLFQHAFGTKLQYFEWLSKEPKQRKAFNTLMEINRANHSEDWFNSYPVEENFQIKDPGAPLLIDIGGGTGHDITAFQAKFPHLSGRLVLQDLDTTIDDVKHIGKGIETMKYDFFQLQPIKGARAYYMRTVIHDWPDKQAREILKRVHEAMNNDSILLLNENALPEENVPLFSADLDLTMMALFASLDRTEKQFRDLLESSGFRLVKVWRPTKEGLAGGTASALLFEAVKATSTNVKADEYDVQSRDRVAVKFEEQHELVVQ